jgi:aconitate hydratase
MTFDIDMIKKVYERYPERIAAARQVVENLLPFQKNSLHSPLGRKCNTSI